MVIRRSRASGGDPFNGEQKNPGDSVVPAQAGVILDYISLFELELCRSRASGGDPVNSFNFVSTFASFPRKRG